MNNLADYTTEGEAAECYGHHFPNYCDCRVHELVRELTVARAVIEAAKAYAKVWGSGEDLVRARDALNQWLVKYEKVTK